MKKFSKTAYFLLMAFLVLSLSGCNGSKGSISSSSNNGSNGNGGSGNGNGSGGSDYTPVDTTNANAVITQENGITKIVLSTSSTASNSSFSTAADTLEVEDYVWHVSPDHAGQYWTNGSNSFDNESDVRALVASQDGIYIARDIRYVPNTLTFSSQTVNKEQSGEDKCYVSYYTTNAEGVETEGKYILAALPAESGTLDTLKSTMTHSPSDAYNYPVLHITKAGSYDISGEWQGQIWVEIPDGTTTAGTDTKKDENAQVVLILNGLTVSCDVAPALVFYDVYRSTYRDSADVIAASMDVAANALADENEYKAGAVVLINSGTNNFYGTNVARLNNIALNDDYTDESLIGTFVKAQGKMYKLDGAFHSRRSMVIDTYDENSTGTLNINANYEGLDSEMHMLVMDGTINVTADDDGINVNEDYTSVFHMSGGSLTVNAPNGDGIDSNGYIIFTGADKLSITAAQDSDQLNAGAEGPLDADLGVYMAQEVQEIYEHSGSNGQQGGDFPGDNQGQQGPGGSTPPGGNFQGGTPPQQQ